MPTPDRKYRQPRRLNAVSVTLLAVLFCAGYFAFACWPAMALHSDVKSLLDDALPRLYRANLLPEPESSIGAEEVRQEVLGRLTKLGIPDPEDSFRMTRDPHTVALSVRLRTAIDLKLIHRKIPLTLNPRVETSAERVTY